ncbi:MAG TPA: alpha/beta hydrolase [Thermoanaerobaculia bacterium]|nr:alpha/beta hydrolase [Thermoanaerobaculia bacterium]
MPERRRFRRVRVVLVRVAGAVIVLTLAVEVLARWNVRREQQRRAYLGDRLFTEVVGDRGDPVVFIAGLQGSTRYWSHGFDDLTKNRRVIYIDLVGFGRSPWPDIAYTLDDHLGYLRRTLVAAGATRNVTIVAHSFGTIVAAHYAARFPADIRRMVLLGTPVYDNEEEGRQRIWDMSPLAAMFSLRPILAREACLLMGAARPLFRWAMPRLMHDVPPAVAEDAVLHSWPSIRGAINNILLARPIARPLQSVGRKTTLVHGTRDTITPLPRIRELALETGATVLVMNCDHHGYAREGRAAIIEVIAAGE